MGHIAYRDLLLTLNKFREFRKDIKRLFELEEKDTKRILRRKDKGFRLKDVNSETGLNEKSHREWQERKAIESRLKASGVREPYPTPQTIHDLQHLNPEQVVPRCEEPRSVQPRKHFVRVPIDELKKEIPAAEEALRILEKVTVKTKDEKDEKERKVKLFEHKIKEIKAGTRRTYKEVYDLEQNQIPSRQNTHYCTTP